MLCFAKDNCHVDLRDTPHWKVYLSDGRTVFQDDGAPGQAISSAWIRLSNFLKAQSQLKIVGIDLSFGTHTVTFPKNKRGYYFSKGIIQGFGQKEGMEYYTIGYVEDDTVNFTWMKIPELEPLRYYSKPVSRCRPPSLILS